MDARHGKVRDLELYLNRNLGVLFTLLILDRRETELGSHQELFSSRELLYAPDHGVLVWNVLDCSYIALEYRGVNVDWYWDDNLDVVGDTLLFKLGTCFNDILDLGFRKVFNDRFDPDQRLYVCV